MGFAALVKSMYLDRGQVAYRPAQAYDGVGVGGYNVFTITGPVYITVLGTRVTAASAVGNVDLIFSVNGVAVDAAAVRCDGAVGLVYLSSLNVAGTALQAAAIPETIATQSRVISGIQPAANGVILATFTTGTYTGDMFCVYRALSPNASIIPA